jgi:hypothetical protein
MGSIFGMGTTMNFLHRLRQHLTGRLAQGTVVVPERPQLSEQDADTSAEPVAFDQVERLNGSGASLETLLEMNRVQGW